MDEGISKAAGIKDQSTAPFSFTVTKKPCAAGVPFLSSSFPILLRIFVVPFTAILIKINPYQHQRHAH